MIGGDVHALPPFVGNTADACGGDMVFQLGADQRTWWTGSEIWASSECVQIHDGQMHRSERET